MRKILSTPRKVKNHVIKHRAKYASATTAVTIGHFYMKHVDEVNTFLKEKNLYDEYYAIGEEI